MGSNDTIRLTLNDLGRLKSRSPRFQSLISRNRAKVGPMLLLTINMKVYVASPITPWYLALSDLERSKSRSHRFQSLIFHKGADRPHVTINHQ